jgi:hypothetical protein
MNAHENNEHGTDTETWTHTSIKERRQAAIDKLNAKITDYEARLQKYDPKAWSQYHKTYDRDAKLDEFVAEEKAL